MIYTKVKFILRTTQNLSCVVSLKSKVEISKTCVAFSEYMNFTYRAFNKFSLLHMVIPNKDSKHRVSKLTDRTL